MKHYVFRLEAFAAFLAFWWIYPVNGEFVSEELSGQMEARGVIAPFYEGSQLKPSLIVRADRVYTDYQRKGFFRIGILPVAVMEGVTMEVRQPESLAHSLEQMNNWLGVRAARRLEFRNLSLVVFTGETNRLMCSRAQFLGGGKWELVGSLQLRVGTNELSAPRATLQINGPQTGQVVLDTSPPTTNSLLFNRTESTNQQTSHEN